MTTVIDLFAGPGGWDIAALALGLDPLGIENDKNAVATRQAAGLATEARSVLDLDPEAMAVGSIDGLIASPPCQGFSAAGKRPGLRVLDDLLAWVRGGEHRRETMPTYGEKKLANSALSLEPMLWAAQVRPKWICCEQVRAVLPLWEAMAEQLEGWGYSTWTGMMPMVQYGVPQTRSRAVLIASTERAVSEPPKTHAKSADPGDNGLRPWVTMAEALGYAVEVNTGRDWKPGGSRADAQKLDGNRVPAPTVTSKSGGQWHLGFPRKDDLGTSEDGYRDRDFFPVDGPSQTITSKSRSMEWRYRSGYERKNQPEVIMPWELQAASTGRGTIRNLSEPSPTVLANIGKQGGWYWRRPATTVMGDARLWPPGHRVNRHDMERLGEDEARDRYQDRAGSEAIRMVPAEAARLQSVPDCFPFQGAKTRQFEQIGNMVPPLAALHVLSMATGIEIPEGLAEGWLGLDWGCPDQEEDT